MLKQENKKLYEQIADQIQARIADGTFPPGQRIPSLRRLKHQYDVSLSTVLEACRLLEDRGLIRARAQSGHYVRPKGARSAPAEPGPSRPRAGTHRVELPLAVRLNADINRPNQATLGSAVQGPELMPTTQLNRLLGQALRHHPQRCHAYDAPPGCETLRRAIARRGVDAGYSVSPEQIVITGGAKEAVYLSIRSATQPGDTVAVESPTYYALLEVLASLELNVVEVASHPRTGLDLDHLERVFGSHSVAALTLVSNFSNPTGALMSDDRKRRLVAILDVHDVPLIEDDVYGDLVFDGSRPKAIKAFDRNGSVLYCCSYSKTLSPGLRVGWAIPGRYQDRFELLKLVVNQATAVAPQLATAAFLDSGGFDRHLRRVRRAYREQMERMIDAVSRYFPEGTRVSRPEGGHVLWVQLPEGADAMALYEQALVHGIRIAPGPMFSAAGGYRDFIRLNTGFPWTPTIEHWVQTLGELVQGLALKSADSNGRGQ